MRSTCLYCEQENITTSLVFIRGRGHCPVHSADYIAALIANAKITLGIPVTLERRGAPAPNRQP